MKDENKAGKINRVNSINEGTTEHAWRQPACSSPTTQHRPRLSSKISLPIAKYIYKEILSKRCLEITHKGHLLRNHIQVILLVDFNVRTGEGAETTRKPEFIHFIKFCSL